MCECMTFVNDFLEAHNENTALACATVVSERDGSVRYSMIIKTKRLRSNTPAERKSKVITVIPSFCPFCGEEIVSPFCGEEIVKT